jgi:aldehyde:ferredoxin oxidoreductase
MKNGCWQRMLRIDLANRKTRVEEIPEKDLREFIGGVGLGAEILRRDFPKRISPFDSRNLLIFGTGPFQGPVVSGKAKFSITGISHQTHTYAETAAGADLGPSFKDSGYDVLVIEGVSERPVYLQIVDDRVEIKDTTYLWDWIH